VYQKRNQATLSNLNLIKNCLNLLKKQSILEIENKLLLPLVGLTLLDDEKNCDEELIRIIYNNC
jgi:hypothetical protein